MEQMYYNTKDVAKLMGVSERRIRTWISTGKLKAVKFPASSRWMVSKEEIARIIGVRANAIDEAEDAIEQTGLDSDATKNAIKKLIDVFDEVLDD